MNHTIENSICGIIIAKDESQSIKRAIESLLPICQQVVLVDTGSKDDTASIASSLSCEVYFKEWTNNFAEARNYALNFARTDWIISLDADERLIIDSFLPFLQNLKDESLGGIKCTLKNFLDDDLKNYSEHKYTRIFRNKAQIRFTGAIHEQISDSIIGCNLSIIDSNITIEHFGYINVDDEKKNRNLEMLERELEKNPSDDWLKYHSATTYFSKNMLSKAHNLFREIENSSQLSQDQRENSRLKLLQIALATNDFDYLSQNADIALKDNDKEGLRLFIMAAFYLSKHNFQEAYRMIIQPATSKSSLVDKTLLEKSIGVLEKHLGIER